MNTLFDQHLPDTSEKKWPWILRWLAPHDGRDRKNLLTSCSCGRIMWMDSSEKIRKHHTGHRMVVCERGTLWQFFKMKTGLLRCRTLGELFRDIMERSKE
jgi:hypothetical protein